MYTWHISFQYPVNVPESIACSNNRVDISFLFIKKDAAENLKERMLNPLMLTAPAAEGDIIDVRCSGARLALYVNGILWDEEWPCGECSLPELVKGDSRFTVSEDCGNLENIAMYDVDEIQGFRPNPTVNVGDCMPFADGDTLRIFYLYDRRFHHSKWGLGAHQWAQISTRDLKHWKMHPMAVSIDEQREGSICTGSTTRLGDRYYAYFAVRACDGTPARLTCAISDDGEHFTKAPFEFSLPEPYHAPSARDPKIIRENGRYVMLVTTSYGEEGCLARLESDDMEHWELKEPEIFTGKHQPECPDRFDFAGHSYLVYGISGESQYRIKDKDGKWVRPSGNGVVVDKSLWVPKAAVFHDRLIIAGWEPDPKGSGWGGTMKLYEGFANEDGSLRFEVLDV